MELLMSQKINNVNVTGEQVLLSPKQLKSEYPLTSEMRNNVLDYRYHIQQIVDGKDTRKIMVVGPCSIHDIAAAKEYALKLKTLHDQCIDTLFIVMRVYFEKPRTTVGWKGFINDPNLDDSFDVESGLRQARELLCWLADLGLPAATEMLDPVTPQYVSDLFSWGAIGARTTESQTHREMSSGLSMPIGFKNGTDGNLNVAINAMQSAQSSHRFLGINQSGQVSLFTTKGNAHAHIILRGGKKPNYDQASVAIAKNQIESQGLSAKFMIDCSHGNSRKDYTNQSGVFDSVLAQILADDSSILGMMLESHLNAGNQKIAADLKQLKYGQSITDACIDWQQTECLLQQAHDKLMAAKNSQHQQVSHS
jgi:3-deoxy-7-phosphoheptulonate synthase